MYQDPDADMGKGEVYQVYQLIDVYITQMQKMYMLEMLLTF